ncbi:MAG: glycosyltransferase family 4 protein [Cyclobacteriaceae bacterium]|nr:glycosyltransferase family 4 protein [Cyclobacteriaceae bacterium]
MKHVDGKLRLLFVGRLELLKGIHTLIKAIRGFTNEALEIVLVGKILPEAIPFIQPCPENITFTGPVNKEQLSKIYSDADALIFPSLNDAFGMVILEAMAHGLPVIGSRFSAAPDIIEHGIDGYILDSNTPEAVAESISWAIDNKEYLAEMGEKARQKVMSHYTLEHYFSRLESNLNYAGFEI